MSSALSGDKCESLRRWLARHDAVLSWEMADTRRGKAICAYRISGVQFLVIVNRRDTPRWRLYVLVSDPEAQVQTFGDADRFIAVCRALGGPQQ